MQDDIVAICMAKSAEEGAELMTRRAGHMQPTSVTMDFRVQAEDVREDSLEGERQPEPRSKTSLPKTQPKDATREVKLDLELTAGEAGKEVKAEGDSGAAKARRSNWQMQNEVVVAPYLRRCFAPLMLHTVIRR